MNSKLTLGTVQFGLDYGINNKNGKISFPEVKKILDFAENNNIVKLDTAFSYGSSQEVIGKYLFESNKHFKIITKVSATSDNEIKQQFNESLNILKQTQVYALLLHNIDDLKKNPKIWEELISLKNQNKVKKIGVSCYYPEEISFLINQGYKLDIVQVPYNIFDQRFEEILKICKSKQIETHVRSVFLQGLFFKKINELPSQFKSIYDKLDQLQNLSKDNNTSLSSICINFAQINEYIDNIVIGVDSLKNLEENISSLNHLDFVKKNIDALKSLSVKDENIILPFNWEKT